MQLVRFALVGVIGFGVDVGCLSVYLAAFPGHLLTGRAISYVAAATTTWAFNARFTFKALPDSLLRQWGRFVIFNLAGGAVNYGAYAVLVTAIPAIASYPAIAVAIGSLCGLGVNFTVSRKFVFKAGAK